MERVFTEDHERYKSGDRKDYPITTWRAYFPGYEGFTVPVEEALAKSASTAKKRAKPNANS